VRIGEAKTRFAAKTARPGTVAEDVAPWELSG
jgi:hypothetical protein